MDLLDDLHRSRGLTSIHVTHNLTFAKRADRVLRWSAERWRPPMFDIGRGSSKSGADWQVLKERGLRHDPGAIASPSFR